MDIEILRIIWWLLIGVVLVGFAIYDGFDFGVAILLPLVARTEEERRIVLNTVGPFWEGNQVWIILGAGATFAAWPSVYAVSFSGFYLLVLLLLLTMGISRPVSFKYRSKLPNHNWRRTWDHIVFIGGFFPAIIFGVLIGNLLIGAPFKFDHELQITYTGTFFNLFTVFSLWCGLTSLVMLTMHGGLYLAIKTEDPVRERAILCARLAATLLIFLFIGGGIWIATAIPGYQVVSGVNPLGVSNPLNKVVMTEVGAWLSNYSLYPYTIFVPLLGIIGALGVIVTARLGKGKLAFMLSCLSITGIIATVGVSMFPFILPSTLDTTSSLLVWDASSSQLTLFVMLIATLFFMPIILLYTTWVYYALRGKVTEKTVEADRQSY